MFRLSTKPPVDYSKCNQKITVYRMNGETITMTVYDRAFFDFRKVESVDKTGSHEVNSALIVIPYFEATEQPLFVGDKVLLGEGEEITTREEWAALIPTKVANMVVVKSVDPKYWMNRIAHWEAGG